MPRVVPSTIVGLIEKHFSALLGNSDPQDYRIRAQDAAKLRTILRAIDSLPDHLLPSGPNDLFVWRELLLATVEIAETVIREGGTSPKQPRTDDNQTFALKAIHELLSQSPDEGPSPTSHALTFITDNTFREVLRTDYTSVDTALANGEWKAATVLAGSVVEALLLWALENMKTVTERTAAVTARHLRMAGMANRFPATLNADVTKWNFEQMIGVSGELNLITKPTSVQADLCRDFRNLIHPAKAHRQGPCDRGTALAAVAAVEQVVKDLTP